MSKRDFKDQLSVLKYRVDNNKMRSYMRKELGSEKLVEREIQIVQSMLNNRCWKIQCKLPPKTKRFCPLVLK